jgi:hypothetical protein
MLQDTQAKLQEEVRVAKRAEHAYNTYLKDKLNKSKLDLLEEFKNSAATTSDLLAIKYKLDAVCEIESAITTDIQSGLLAAEQLKSYEA